MNRPLAAMTGLEICCIISAYLQWLIHSGKRAVGRGPLVLFILYFIIEQEHSKTGQYTPIYHFTRIPHLYSQAKA